jgi:hypothetical protein
MKDLKITCDFCSRDLTYTGNCIDWYLSLKNEQMMTLGNVLTCAMIYPKIDKDAHFCGLDCLKKWISK